MRILIGVLLILHGLAHAGAGMWARGPLWLVTPLWWITTTAFLAAGFGAGAILPFRRHVEHLAVAGAVASVTMLYFFLHPLVIPGVLLDVVLVTLVSYPSIADRLAAPAEPTTHLRRAKLAFFASAIFLAYTSGVILLRPWFMRMGTRAEDRSVALFGDRLYPDARYILDHAITIHAPADSVWPWLAQIGQDRAGFYSYSMLENLFGAHVTNSDSLVPVWQNRHVGELVRAVPPDYLGGRLGRDVGWHIVAMDSGRALVLENWGAFVVRPLDDTTTRLHIRQRSPGTPSLVGTLMAPAGLLILEPAHFIMQRAMLRGIKKRVERQAT